MTDVSEQQRANLAQLAAYLRTLPADYPDFAMSTFTSDQRCYGNDPAHVPECGTAACAAGHGPIAGIAPEAGENWYRYSTRAFVGPGSAWDWCFSATWSQVDNTAHGAAARIEWFLDKGVPANGVDQVWGTAPLCYSAALLAAPRAGEGVNGD